MAGTVTEILMGLLMAVYYAAEKIVKLFLPQAMFEKDISGQVNSDTFGDYWRLTGHIRGCPGDGRWLWHRPPDVPEVRQARSQCGHLGCQQDRQRGDSGAGQERGQQGNRLYGGHD